MHQCLRCNQPCVMTSKFCESCQSLLHNQLQLRAFQTSPLLSPAEYSSILSASRASGDFDLRHTSLWEEEHTAIGDFTGEGEQDRDLSYLMPDAWPGLEDFDGDEEDGSQSDDTLMRSDPLIVRFVTEKKKAQRATANGRNAATIPQPGRPILPRRAAPAPGRLQASSAGTATVNVSAGTLLPGIYSSFILFLTAQRTQTVTVQLTVLPSSSSFLSPTAGWQPTVTVPPAPTPPTPPVGPPVLGSSPSNLNFSSIEGEGNPDRKDEKKIKKGR